MDAYFLILNFMGEVSLSPEQLAATPDNTTHEDEAESVIPNEMCRIDLNKFGVDTEAIFNLKDFLTGKESTIHVGTNTLSLVDDKGSLFVSFSSSTDEKKIGLTEFLKLLKHGNEPFSVHEAMSIFDAATEHHNRK